MGTWDMRRTAGALVVAVAVAGVGGAAIAAATDGGHSMMDGGMHGFGGPPRSAPVAKRVGTQSNAQPDALHGEYVVADGHGGFTTQLSQTGRVTAISPGSITARSDDGFVRTYVIRAADGATTPTFAVGDEVAIDATREGEAAVVSTMRPPLSSGG